MAKKVLFEVRERSADPAFQVVEDDNGVIQTHYGATYASEANVLVGAKYSVDASGKVTGLVGPDDDFYLSVTVAPSGDTTGVTDAAAINAALRANSRVQLITGDYYINATLILEAPYVVPGYSAMGQTLAGNGIGETRITMVTAGIPAIQKGDLYNAIACNLEGFLLTGPGTLNADSVGFMSEKVGGGYYVRDVFIQDFATAVRLYDATLTKFDGLQIRACGWGVELGYNVDAAAFRSCRIQECESGGVFVGWKDESHPAVPTTNSDNITFDNCIFARQAVSFDVSDSNSTCITVRDCYFEDEGKIAWIGVAGEVTSAKSIVFDACHIEYSATTPAQSLIEYREPLLAAGDISIINCFCQDTLASGVAYLVAGIKTAIRWEKNKFPYTDIQIKYYTATAQFISLVDIGSVAIPSTLFHSGTQLSLLSDWAILGKPAISSRLSNGTGGTHAEFKRIASNTGVQAGEAATVYDVDGKWVVFKGVHQLISPTAALPTAASTYRGCMAYQSGGAGAADTVKCCMKSAADTYSWVTVVTG